MRCVPFDNTAVMTVMSQGMTMQGGRRTLNWITTLLSFKKQYIFKIAGTQITRSVCCMYSSPYMISKMMYSCVRSLGVNKRCSSLKALQTLRIQFLKWSRSPGVLFPERPTVWFLRLCFCFDTVVVMFLTMLTCKMTEHFLKYSHFRVFYILRSFIYLAIVYKKEVPVDSAKNMCLSRKLITKTWTKSCACVTKSDIIDDLKQRKIW